MTHRLIALERSRWRLKDLIRLATAWAMVTSMAQGFLPSARADQEFTPVSSRTNESQPVQAVTDTRDAKSHEVERQQAIGKRGNGRRANKDLTTKKESGSPARKSASPSPDPKSMQVTQRGLVPLASQTVGAHEATQVQVTMGTSVILDLAGQIKRASVTSPEIANIQIVPPDQILVNGKTPGVTTVIAWVGEERRYFDVTVTANLSSLQRALKDIAPQDEIAVKAVQNSVVVSGTVSSPSLIPKVADVAKAFLPDKAAVVNLLQLGEPHQIMLKVEVAEVNRTALRELGLDFIHSGAEFAIAVFGGTTGGVLNTTIDKDGTVLFDPRTSATISRPQSRTNALLRALEQKGLLKSLARPTLIAASGADAHFLVGGEFPFPVVTGGGVAGTTAVTIEFKPFGVRLDFIPTLNDLGSINLKIMPEVSDLDFVNAVTISGFNIPSLTTRRVRTIVDLKPGQSLAIGGLLKSDDRKTLTKFPLLGDIPVLGALFRSTKFIRNETDLIVFVTPEIVKPVEAGQLPNLEEQMHTTPEEEKEIRQIPGR